MAFYLGMNMVFGRAHSSYQPRVLVPFRPGTEQWLLSV